MENVSYFMISNKICIVTGKGVLMNVLLGLTSIYVLNTSLQIQFFDLEGNLIPFDEHHVSISGHVGDKGVLGNLANGKTKVWLF